MTRQTVLKDIRAAEKHFINEMDFENDSDKDLFKDFYKKKFELTGSYNSEQLKLICKAATESFRAILDGDDDSSADIELNYSMRVMKAINVTMNEKVILSDLRNVKKAIFNFGEMDEIDVLRFTKGSYNPLQREALVCCAENWDSSEVNSYKKYVDVIQQCENENLNLEEAMWDVYKS